MSVLGPVLHCELLRLGRRRRYFLLRFAFLTFLLIVFLVSSFAFYEESKARAAGGVVVGGAFYSSRLARGNVNQAMTQAAASFSHDLFMYVQMVELALLLLVAPIVVASTLGEEKEKHSLDLLFVTGLSDREIIWGKLGSRLMLLGCLVVSAYPLLAVTLTLGGVEPSLIGAFLLANLATLFAVAGLAIWFSVHLRTLRGAIIGSFLVLLALNAAWLVPALLWDARPWLQARYPEWVEFVAAWRKAAASFSAFGFLVEVMDGQIRGQSVSWPLVIFYCGTQLLLGLAAQALAVPQLRPAHLRQQLAQARADHASRRRPRTPLWQAFPLYWKEMTARAVSPYRWLLWLLVVAGSALWLVPPVLDVLPIFMQDNFQAIRTWRVGGVSRALPPPLQAFQFLLYSLPVGIILAALLALLITLLRAAGAVAQERDRQTWDDLLSAPVRCREIVNSKTLGSLWASRAPFAYFLVLLLVSLLLWPWFLPTAVGLYLVAVLLLASQLGLLVSLFAKTALRAWVSASLILAAMIVVPIVTSGLLPRGDRVANLAEFILVLLDAASHMWVLALAVIAVLVVAKFSPRRLQAVLLAGVRCLAIGVPVFVLVLLGVFVMAENLGISMPASTLALLLSPPGAMLYVLYENTFTQRLTWEISSALVVVAIMFLVWAIALWLANHWLLARTCGRVDGYRQAKRFPKPALAKTVPAKR